MNSNNTTAAVKQNKNLKQKKSAVDDTVDLFEQYNPKSFVS